MAERAFIDSIAAWLKSALGLPSGQVGSLQPPAGAALPAIAIWLETTARRHAGLGGGSTAMRGALEQRFETLLQSPILPGAPDVEVISADRRTMVLPSGGLVQSDGSSGPLGPPDLQVSVAGVSQTVVSGAPGAGQVRAQPAVGRLIFGAALPANGPVVVTYWVGEWERRTAEIAGVLQFEVWGSAGAQALDASNAVLDAVGNSDAGGRPAGVRRLEIASVGPVQAEAGATGRFSRQIKVRFEYLHTIDTASGGVILAVPVTMGVSAAAGGSTAVETLIIGSAMSP